MLKGYRTYIAATGGILTGAGMVINALITGDNTHFSEGISLIFISGAQIFQRAAVE